MVKNDGVDLPDGSRMKSIDEDGYKYLGILEYDEVLHAEIKIRLQNEYYRRLEFCISLTIRGRCDQLN